MPNSRDDSYRRDRTFSDGFLPHIKQILGEHLFEVSSIEIDRQEATDLVLRLAGRGDVAVRIRRAHIAARFPYDITFRSYREHSRKTELDKIIEGKALWMFYGFGATDGQHVVRWVLLDLAAFRAAYARQQISRKSQINNGDGTFGDVYDVRSFTDKDPPIILGTSHVIPVPEAGDVARRPSKKEFFQKLFHDEAS